MIITLWIALLILFGVLALLAFVVGVTVLIIRGSSNSKRLSSTPPSLAEREDEARPDSAPNEPMGD